jgi:indolepyruvate ferredoxin oxidoreductase
MPLRPVTLGDKYDLEKSPVFVTGYQAIIRLCLMQKERDRRAGLNTAGYVTGYRGSPLGGLDQQFERAEKILKANDILFQAGLNEDLAATALWGSQQAELRGEGKFDGVFGIWYGKGPGVDRSGDVFRHANGAGTSKHGGVLALMGDDHTAESSTTAHQSEFNFVNVAIPVLNPAGVQEIIDYGLYGWAMSRYTGAWVGLKCMHETVESTAVVDGRLDRVDIVIPGDDEFRMPPDGLNIRLGDTVLGMEARLQDFKRDAMLAFVRANKLNRVIISGSRVSASSPSAKAISTCARRSKSSASTKCAATISVSGSTRSAAPIRSAATRCSKRPRASTFSSSSRRSVRWSRCRCARNCMAPRISRSASARRTRTATGCSR